MTQNTQLFSYVFLILKLRIISLFKEINVDTSLPPRHGNFTLEKTLKVFPCGIGIYKNNKGDKVLIKTWKGSVKTYEYDQLLKEVRLYELFHRVLTRIGHSIESKYQNVRIPKIIEKEITPNSIIAVFEYLQDCTHLSDVTNLSEKSRIYELATDFWRYLGSFLTPSERKELPKRNYFETLFIYFFVLVYAMFRYPKQIPKLIRASFIITKSFPLLYKNWCEELIHRDFHFENVLVNNDYVAVIDFGDNALTHPYFIFANSLHWGWDNQESREVILKNIVDISGKSEETSKLFRAIFAMIAVQFLHDTGSKKKLELNYRCFDGVLYNWSEISNVLGGNNKRKNSISFNMTKKERFSSFLRKIRAPIMRYLKPASGYVLLDHRTSLKPLSAKYGFDRGTPIDRYYIDKFLSENKQFIYGRCLEIHDNYYTVKFGEDRVTKSDVLDLHQDCKNATIYGNLKNIPHVPDNSFDCIILTQTLGMIDDCDAALYECYRILKPDGHLLFTSKAMGPVYDPEGSYWKFTRSGIKYLFSKFFNPNNLEVSSFGNVLVGQAFWVGMAVEDLRTEDLEHDDSRYEIIITAVAKK
ncbi:MAG: methyltransferase domain-containing protein [Patescibacteria group bacterium]